MNTTDLQLLGLFVVVFLSICAIGINEVKLRAKKSRSSHEHLHKLTVKELRKLAKDHKVREYWLKRKSQLIEDLRNSEDLDA